MWGGRFAVRESEAAKIVGTDEGGEGIRSSVIEEGRRGCKGGGSNTVGAISKHLGHKVHPVQLPRIRWEERPADARVQKNKVLEQAEPAPSLGPAQRRVVPVSHGSISVASYDVLVVNGPCC